MGTHNDVNVGLNLGSGFYKDAQFSEDVFFYGNLTIKLNSVEILQDFSQ